jgi:hypothetical protein
VEAAAPVAQEVRPVRQAVEERLGEQAAALERREGVMAQRSERVEL